MSYNKNLKLYVQNINKSSRKEYYHTSSQVYLNEIYEINRKIISGEAPIENMINQLEYLKRKYNVFKNKDKSNAYLTLSNLINTINYKNNAQIYQGLVNDLSENLLIANTNLNEKIEELANCLSNKKSFTLPEISLNTNISINMEYIIYIREYGMPENGIFIETRLQYIRYVYL